MKELLGQRVLVSKVEEPKAEGFTTVNVMDSFIYKGKIEQLGDGFTNTIPAKLNVGDTVLFAKYSPDTQEVELNGEKMKVVVYADIIGVL